MLKNAFVAFDHEKKGCIGIDMIGTILELLGHSQTQSHLEMIIKEVDVDGKRLTEFTAEGCGCGSERTSSVIVIDNTSTKRLITNK